ncbi:MAG: hypothetical protein AAGL17_20070 [Cyanobacteria bacterium J06576_12]
MSPKDQSPKAQPAKDKPATELFPADSKGISPYYPKQLIDIFVAPGQFFSAQAALGKPLNVWIASLLIGFSSVFYGISNVVVLFKQGNEDLKPPPEILSSWGELWLFLLVGGFVLGIILWIVGGWWFRVRLVLSGAPEPDGQMARLVYIYSTLVRSLPAFITLLVWSFLYPNLDVAYEQGALFVSQFLSAIFLFGELITAYIGIKTLFSVDRARAMLWFVFAPAVMYAVSLGDDILSDLYL